MSRHLLSFLPRPAGPLAPEAVLRAFRTPGGDPDPLRCALLLAGGREAAERLLGDGAAVVVDEILGWPVRVSGAEAVAALLAHAGVRKAFIYAGTSELALGDAVERVEGIRLVNGRGDRESAFMAAGASLLEPHRGVAILHGARGLTNAMGAVADARRSEVGTLVVVGLPTTGSARFLPPHGEPGLLDGLSGLVDRHWQAGPIPDEDEARDREARRFVTEFRRALAFSARPPHSPTLFGVPQDVAERRWLPLAALATPPAADPPPVADPAALESAADLLAHAERPLFLVDDYALRFAGIRQRLDRISAALGAPVLQVRYRRGPMLFERLRRDEVRAFAGWLDPFDAGHRELLSRCDLLITVEDRNIYERVVGRLPDCRKIAINTDPEKVLKNEYLAEKDVLVAGDPAAVLAKLGDVPPRSPWHPQKIKNSTDTPHETVRPGVRDGRRSVARALAGTLAGWERPVLVDDSQMFGGLIAEHYDDLPAGLRVFGGHGAFVGSGLPYATGLAIADRRVRVMCTLGDQAFTNAMQGLVAAVQERARVLYVVCNNGESVSLKKQGAASYGHAERPWLSNAEGLRYHALAGALGIPCARIGVPLDGPAPEVEAAIGRLSAALAEASGVDGPSMVELVLPPAPEVWAGIWLTQGLEQAAAR